MMHKDEIEINTTLVRQLLSSQFPEWADLPIHVIKPEGTDNSMYKLGLDKVVRLPRIERAVPSLETEFKWLPKLAPHLPISIPVILGKGNPEAFYPFPWMVCRYLEGKSPVIGKMLNHHQTAIDLGNFVVEMQKITLPGGAKSNRGKPLSEKDQEVREAISLSQDTYDPALLTKIWDACLEIGKWTGKPVWVHGDLHGGNVLARDGKITAVVDFGLAGIGDPACDMMPAWTLLTSETREIFRSIVQPDNATWIRGLGWGLSYIVAYPYYRNTNSALANIAKRTVDEVLNDKTTHSIIHGD